MNSGLEIKQRVTKSMMLNFSFENGKIESNYLWSLDQWVKRRSEVAKVILKGGLTDESHETLIELYDSCDRTIKQILSLT